METGSSPRSLALRHLKLESLPATHSSRRFLDKLHWKALKKPRPEAYWMWHAFFTLVSNWNMLSVSLSGIWRRNNEEHIEHIQKFNLSWLRLSQLITIYVVTPWGWNSACKPHWQSLVFHHHHLPKRHPRLHLLCPRRTEDLMWKRG